MVCTRTPVLKQCVYLSLRLAKKTFCIGRFRRSYLGQHAVNTLANMILLASLTKMRQYCDAEGMLQKATTENTYIYIHIKETG